LVIRPKDLGVLSQSLGRHGPDSPDNPLVAVLWSVDRSTLGE